MRTGLQKLDGVNSVEVSLEKGLAKIELKPENKITLSQIQTIVKKNGFSPKSAQLKLKGKMGDKQVTITKSNESITAVWNEEQLIDPQKEYVIQGNLEITEKDSQITVSSIQEK